MPIVVVSARGDPVERVVGLELGADDYLVKPFSSRELAARIRAVIRRTGGRVPPDSIAIGQVVLEPRLHRVTVRGRVVGVPARQFDLLHLLMRNAGRVVRREDILDELWVGAWFGSSKVLDRHVAGLRELIEEDRDSPRYLITVRGVGFRFATDDDLSGRAASSAG